VAGQVVRQGPRSHLAERVGERDGGLPAGAQLLEGATELLRLRDRRRSPPDQQHDTSHIVVGGSATQAIDDVAQQWYVPST
jgi:hypothetical protein